MSSWFFVVLGLFLPSFRVAYPVRAAQSVRRAGQTVGNWRGEERDPLESLLLGFGWVGSFRASVPAHVRAMCDSYVLCAYYAVRAVRHVRTCVVRGILVIV